MSYRTSAKLMQAILIKNEPPGVGGVWNKDMVALMSRTQHTCHWERGC